MLFLKKADPITLQEIQKQNLHLLNLPKKKSNIKEDTKNYEKKESKKKEIPKIDLKYYNLSLEKNYNQEYNKTKNKTFTYSIPPLNKIYIEPKNDLDFNIKPELNFDKQTKEITIDGVHIQLEKKF